MKFVTSSTILLSAFFVCGCQTSRPRPLRLSFERSWVQSTLASENLGYRLLNRMTPLVLDNEVIEGNGIDGIAAYNRKQGYLIWRLDIANGVEAGVQYQDGTVYFGAGDGKFYAVNAQNGSVLWTFPIHAQGLAQPLIQNGRIFFLAGNNIAYALDAKTGKQIWRVKHQETGSFSVRGGTQPASSGNVVYIGFSGGEFVAFHASDGGVIWERQLSQNPRFKDVDASPVIDGDKIFVSSFDGTLYCLTKTDGQIVWRFDEGGDFPVTLHGDKIYYATSSRKLVSLDKASGKLLWSVPIKDGMPTQPVVYRNYLVLGNSEGALEVRSMRDGHLVTAFDPGRGISATPRVIGRTGEVYFISNEANLYSLVLSWNRGV